MEHPDRFVVSCSREPQRVGQMRRIGAAHLRKWGLNSVVDTASLLISELVTNAVRYGTEDITFSMSHRAGEITIEVADGSSEFPRVRQPTADGESGRGMFLVEALADRWGTSEDGARTWCSIAAPQLEETIRHSRPASFLPVGRETPPPHLPKGHPNDVSPEVFDLVGAIGEGAEVGQDVILRPADPDRGRSIGDDSSSHDHL
ncbi:ATP-binding protein [Streptomyces roseirectus]|uniref:ATP-binding protein n=1 Tax=Streptomyces roseirectus TaxID=2768066 RepID=UPI001FE728C3|nr:ATP-binding protein [Streptomyces roseirectus]